MKLTPYREFRTGLTYRDVYLMLWVPSEDKTLWRHKSRGVVLGLWHQIKKELYDRYLGENVVVLTEGADPNNDNATEERTAG